VDVIVKKAEAQVRAEADAGSPRFSSATATFEAASR
jgi:hypothetical protein